MTKTVTKSRSVGGKKPLVAAPKKDKVGPSLRVLVQESEEASVITPSSTAPSSVRVPEPQLAGTQDPQQPQLESTQVQVQQSPLQPPTTPRQATQQQQQRVLAPQAAPTVATPTGATDGGQAGTTFATTGTTLVAQGDDPGDDSPPSDSNNDDTGSNYAGGRQPGRWPLTPRSLTPQAEVSAVDERPLRVSVKNVTIEKFSGEKSGGLDAGAQRWWNKFARQLHAAEIYAGSRPWPNDVKITVLGDFLTGMAEAWYDDMGQQLHAMSFEDVGAALVRHFQTALTDLQITTPICTARKFATETYQEFANRLLGMADLVKNGRMASHNARLALQTFCARAYPAVVWGTYFMYVLNPQKISFSK
jgi:hypothetical protein